MLINSYVVTNIHRLAAVFTIAKLVQFIALGCFVILVYSVFGLFLFLVGFLVGWGGDVFCGCFFWGEWDLGFCLLMLINCILFF